MTRILHAIQEGQTQAAAELLPLVYEELRRLAAAKMARENAGQRQASMPPYLNAPRRITESLERLLQLYDAWGKPAQAAEWKQKLAAFQQANPAAEKKGAQP